MTKALSLLFLGLALAPLVAGRTDTVVILHTNDIHAHLRADYDGVGGLSFVSGYIASQRSERTDILVLDAGDVAEKGDLVAFATDCEIVYEAMGQIGFDAGAPGNHDYDFGLDQLNRFAELAAPMQMLCVNLMDDEGERKFAASSIFDVDGVRVGVIGMITPQDNHTLDAEATATAIALEAERLEPEVDLTVALCHDSVKACKAIARAAPLVDLFVSGHSHEALHEAVTVPETGARIVQAGCYAEFVGRVELTIDLDSGDIVQAESGLVPMDHKAVPSDVPMQEWIRRSEQTLAPDAARLVGWTDREIDYRELADLGAYALRRATGADVAFCAPGQIIRAKLPRGLIDVNAVFRTGGERGHRVVETRLPGSVIEAYLLGMEKSDYYQTSWAGFRATIDASADGLTIQTDLDPKRLYRVVLPEKEWETRFLRLARKANQDPGKWNLDLPAKAPPSRLIDASFTDAVVGTLESPEFKDRTLTAVVEEVVRRQGFANTISGSVGRESPDAYAH